MRLHRFIGPFDCSQPRIEISDPDIVNQILRVLRLGVGDQLVLADGKTNECIGEIVDRQKDELVVSVIERYVNTNEPTVSCILYCAILKRENFELVVQKATEIGVREIVPVVSQRTVKLDIKAERLQKIVKEAAEQSGRGRLPIVHSAMPFGDALNHAKHNNINIFFDFSDVPVESIAIHGTQRRGLFIGPEGGWTEAEADAARVAGHAIGSLGALTFRAETAAIIASYLGTRD